MAEWLLAQYNVGKLRYPRDDPRMAEFFDNVGRINALAERIDGFVWRLQDSSGTALNMDVGDASIVPNLTLWRDVESLRRFAFQTAHKRFFERREEWFIPLPCPNVLWYWPDWASKPPLTDGIGRRAYMLIHGPTRHGFSWNDAEQFRPVDTLLKV